MPNRVSSSLSVAASVGSIPVAGQSNVPYTLSVSWTNPLHTLTMKIRHTYHLLAMLLSIVFTTQLHAQTSAFTYQGFLTENGVPLNGSMDFQFVLFKDLVAGAPQSTTINASDVGVNNGVFTVVLDFGAAVFNGSDRWLEISARPGASAGAYTNLSPRQQITSAPYSVKSAHAMTVAMGIISDPDFIGTTTDTALDFSVNNERGLRLQYASGGMTSVNLIGGYGGNHVGIQCEGAVIGGGGASNGFTNSIGDFSDYTTIGGGIINRIGLFVSFGTIAGGGYNQILDNTVYGVVSGGRDNTLNPNTDYSVIPGGQDNAIGTDASHAFAAGRRAQANHSGAFVWADSTDADFTSTGTDQFLIRASGGVGVGTGDPDGATLRVQGNSTLGDIWLSPTTAGGNADVFFSETVSGSFGIKLRHNGASNGFEFVGVNSSVETAPLVTIGRGSSSGVTIANNLAVGGNVTANAFVTSSDRNLKENFQPVTPLQVLEKVVGLPISQWNFKTDADATHVGPMAQDFRTAFGLGTDERHIATVDADGVALAAIQGLNQKVERENAEIAELKQRLDKLERLINQQSEAAR